MTEVAGKDGSVYADTSKVTGINAWALDQEANMLETTEFEDAWRTFVAGLKRWSGTFSGLYQSGPAPQDNPTAGDLDLGTSVSLNLKFESGHFLYGVAYVSRIGSRTEVDGVETVDYSFQGNATLAYA